jgi:hypothetical protein
VDSQWCKQFLITVAEVELDGYVIPKGRMLTLSTLAAMRWRKPSSRKDWRRWSRAFPGCGSRAIL